VVWISLKYVQPGTFKEQLSEVMPELASVQACNILCLLLTDFFF